jgi:glucose-6-phosphate isomerase
MAFNEYISTQKLQSLSAHPIDLTDKGVFTAKRLEAYQREALGIKMLFAGEPINDAILNALFDLAHESDALKKMSEMQNGVILNKIEGYESENRQVLHTAMRDFFTQKNTAKEAVNAAHLAYQEVEKLKKFTLKIENEKRIDTFVQIGIGGSDLGPKAIFLSLQAYQKKHKKVFFVSNVDPDDAALVLREIDLKKTLFIIVSKSGNTLETLTNETLFRQHYEALGIDPKEHFVAVTGKGSPMDNPSHYLESFYIWDYIGGRYSVTSMVGGVILSLGISFDVYMEFLKGASAMDKVALRKDPNQNLPLLGALFGIWNRNFLKLETLAVLPYSQALLRFTAHLQQLDMESNGKRVTKEGKFVDFETGPIIWGEPGTNGQHSFYQSIHQGTSTVPLCFIGFKESQRGEDLKVEKTTSQEKLLSNLFAQSLALSIGEKNKNPNKFFPGNRPNHLLLAKKLDPFISGALLSYFEHKVAFQGFIWGINSFDQEGVQLGKVLAKEFLRLITSKHEGKELKKDDFTLGQAYLRALESF